MTNSTPLKPEKPVPLVWFNPYLSGVINWDKPRAEVVRQIHRVFGVRRG